MGPIQELYNTFSSFQRLFICLDMISGLGVMTFEVEPGCSNSALDRIARPEKSKHLSPNSTAISGNL
jgi:hypothetical protein